MKQHEAWITKASNDLKSAKKLADGIEPIYDTAIYHTQQTAEKALKSYLSFIKQPIQKIHNLRLLLELCVDSDQSFRDIFDDAEILSPYDTAFRYPDIILEPDREDVLDAIQRAERIFNFVNQKIMQQ